MKRAAPIAHKFMMRRQMASADRLPATGAELAMSQGMNPNSNTRRPPVKHEHRREFVTAVGRAAAMAALVVYLGGVRFLLHQGALWLAMCEQIVRRALGCP